MQNSIMQDSGVLCSSVDSNADVGHFCHIKKYCGLKGK